ncbi:MAG: hypothetical protein US31_C0006G0063 [Berkelbacteria bacterium GW2011_GWA1_36_9]|uniref:Uncharacterized protein n=1 Tax=Berkelbacteria bacterium GW2011_GWA1_36_9 TaxID=1618331 RepID=A0A0G0FKN1_9BACT|nr:MAG: hypothetical protein US31_C0006G0063 [Berkelbacteria bacterium GW2011_GWA1_36_9]
MLDKNDETKIEKIMVKVVGNALEQIVLPRLQSIEDKQEEQGEKLTELADGSEYLKDTVTRIELKFDSEVKRSDEHGVKIEKLNIKVLKLETKRS